MSANLRKFINKKRSGFTLVEVLVVIGIIAMLVAILIPSVSLVKEIVKTKTSQSSLTMIEAGIKLYKNDFGDVPPSDFSSGPMRNLDGSQLIAVFMTGYADNDGTKGTPLVDGSNRLSLHTDDGKSGFGFRTKKRGKVYGPYNGCENIDIKTVDSSPVFMDAFENPILYYRRNNPDQDDANSNYVASHNDGPTYASDSACQTFCPDFMLLTKGPNEKWDDGNGSNPDNWKNHKPTGDFDDITNFSK